MKTKTVLISVFACFILLAVVSCTKVTDLKISALEKSIDKLENDYKDMTPKEIENTIELCEKQLNALLDNESDLTKEQQKKVSNLEGRYHRVLLKVQLYLMVNDFLDETGVQSTIEYIKGLLGANLGGSYE